MFEFLSAGALKGRKIRHFHSDYIEPQEVFLDNLARKKEEELGISEKKFEVPLSSNSIKAFLAFFILSMVFLLGKTFQMQVLDYKKYSVLTQENRYIIQSIEAGRGVIYDANNAILASNKPSFNLIINKDNFPKNELDQEKILAEISSITGVSVEDFKGKISKNSKSNNPITLISEIIDHEKLIILQAKIDNWPGVEIEKSTVREYKDGQFFSHVIGYTGMVTEEELEENPEIYSNIDQIGRAGIEKTYEDVLKRNAGKIRIERDAIGNQIKKEVVSLPESGRSLRLWLDSDLQKKISEELKKTMESVNAKSAVGIAINPKTGGVLAMVSLPEFDNNLFSQKTDPEALKSLLVDKGQPLLNRVVSGKYASGSTIKPFEASAALEENLISPDKLIDDKGYIFVKSKYNPSVVYKYTGIVPHGLVDMRKALAVSSNIYFYTIGGGYESQKGLGPSNIEKYLSLFGWSDKTGIDIPNEAKGFIPTIEWKKNVKKEGWWDGDTYNLSIGQGDLGVTPIEVANAFASIANGGKLYSPKIVKEMIDNENNKTQEIQPEIIRENFIDSKNLQVVKEGMRLAVTAEDTPQASCKQLNSLPVEVACKTGTAQTSYQDHYHNWITIFAPYDDPEIVITLMVENVSQHMAIVIPTMNEILKWYFDR